jgi:hypothetical protein
VLGRHAGKYWLCRCVCGKEESLQTPWKGNAKKSCGCTKKNWRLMTPEERSKVHNYGARAHYRVDEQKMLCGVTIANASLFTSERENVTCGSCKRLLEREVKE